MKYDKSLNKIQIYYKIFDLLNLIQEVEHRKKIHQFMTFTYYSGTQNYGRTCPV